MGTIAVDEFEQKKKKKVTSETLQKQKGSIVREEILLKCVGEVRRVNGDKQKKG